MKSKVFLCHAGEDVVLTRLIGGLLEKQGLSCFYSERDIAVSLDFRGKILDSIHESQCFVIVWTAAAKASQWVNQEIGIAIAEQIPIWTLRIENIPLSGPLIIYQVAEPWLEPDTETAMFRIAQAIVVHKPDAKSVRVDRHVEGKEARTLELTKLLSEQNDNHPEGFHLRIQAAFSSFAVEISSASKAKQSGYTDEHYELLLEERRELEDMISWAESVQILLWPERRDCPAEGLATRFQNLLNFVRNCAGKKKVSFAVGKFKGGNVHILGQSFLVRGIKSETQSKSYSPGYEWAQISSHGPTIALAIREFDWRFKQFSVSRETVLSQLEEMAKQAGL